jgi:hypothetical protein
MRLLSIGLHGECVITGFVCLGTDGEGRANNCIINRHGYRLGSSGIKYTSNHMLMSSLSLSL